MASETAVTADAAEPTEIVRLIVSIEDIQAQVYRGSAYESNKIYPDVHWIRGSLQPWSTGLILGIRLVREEVRP
jgi:hypothetical protein